MPAGFGLHALDDPGRVLPVWDCPLQDAGANRILQLLNAAARVREDSEALPSLGGKARCCPARCPRSSHALRAWRVGTCA